MTVTQPPGHGAQGPAQGSAEGSAEGSAQGSAQGSAEGSAQGEIPGVRRFEILSHTADVGFRAWAGSLEDLFSTAATAMFSIEYDTSTVAAEQEVSVAAEADDVEGLLEAWLSELLFLHDAQDFVPGEVVAQEVTGHAGPEQAARVRGVARGAILGEWFEQTGPQVKAVTLHGLEVRPAAGGWEAVVYLDV